MEPDALRVLQQKDNECLEKGNETSRLVGVINF